MHNQRILTIKIILLDFIFPDLRSTGFASKMFQPKKNTSMTVSFVYISYTSDHADALSEKAMMNLNDYR